MIDSYWHQKLESIVFKRIVFERGEFIWEKNSNKQKILFLCLSETKVLLKLIKVNPNMYLMD